MNGQGRPFKGRTGQDDPSNRYHQATRDEGSRNAAIRPGRTFFSLVFFVRAKKSNSPKLSEGQQRNHLLEIEKTPQLF